MRIFRTLLLCGVGVALAGCDEGDGLVGTAPNVPLAYTRFVNAVADFGDQDWRFIDQVEYSPPAFGLGFREFTPYQGTAPGNRPLRVFPTSDNIAETSVRLIDETVTLEAGSYYTFVHTGLVGDGSNNLVVIQDNHPGVDAGEFAIRALHLGTGWGNIDIYGAASVGTSALGSSLFSNVSFGAVTDYDTLATGPVALRALPAGQTVRLMAIANTEAPEGEPAEPDVNLTAIGGTEIGGSAILGIFTPGSVLDTDAPQGTAFVARTTDETLRASATGFERSTGSFIDNNFFIGQEIEVEDFTNGANVGEFVITGLQDFPRTGDIELERTATGYVRHDDGSFIDDGFTVGMDIYVVGFDSAANNGPQTVAAVTDTELTVGASADLEEESDGRSICADPCSVMTVDRATVVEAANGDVRIRGPRPAWVYIVDRHPQ